MARLAVALALVAAISGCGERTQEPPPERARWRVYSSLPHSGERADVHLAAKLAAEEGPADVEHVALDSTRRDVPGRDWEVGVVTGNARRAAADPRAAAYVGETASGASAVTMPILGAAGIAQIAPGGTYTGLTRAEGAEEGEPGRYRGDGGPHFVRVIPADHLQAAAALSWMRRLGTRRLLTVSDGEFYGSGMAAMVAARARRAGITVFEVGIDPHRLATIRDVAERVPALAVDTVYFGGIWQNRAAALWGRVHRADPGVRLMSGDGVADPAFTRAILRSSRARTFITSAELPPPSPFARRFRARFGHPPHPLALYGHEAMRRALAAVAEAGGDRRAVINGLFAAPDVDANGDVTRGRFGGYRVSPGGGLVRERVLVVSGR